MHNIWYKATWHYYIEAHSKDSSTAVGQNNGSLGQTVLCLIQAVKVRPTIVFTEFNTESRKVWN